MQDELPGAGLNDPRAFTWVKTADEILETLATCCGLIYRRQDIKDLWPLPPAG